MTNLSYRSVGFKEVRLEECVKEVPCDALNCVINWQQVNFCAILDIRRLRISHHA